MREVMSRKRKCFGISFIVVVSVLVILRNHLISVFDTWYHCTNCGYQLPSESFKHHKNLSVPQCSIRILTVAPGGRLGNTIWEYISLLAFQKVYHFNGSIFLFRSMKKVLQNLLQRVHVSELSQCIFGRQMNYSIQNIGLMEKPNSSSLAVDNWTVVNLEVFSCRYGDLIDYGLENMRQKLRFHQKWINQGTNVLKHIKSTFGFNETDTVTFIGVHYRGGDYDRDLRAVYNQKFIGPASHLYYGKAMEYFEQTTKNPIFVFVTIEDQWAKENLVYLQNFKIFEHHPIGATEDLVVLSLCNHSIINYGTYGVTSAFLANGTTFVYDLQLPNDGRGYTLANNVAKVFPNWYLCDNSRPCNNSTRN